MRALQPNSETGFLESNRMISFDSAKKVKFIALAKEAAENHLMPDLVAICKAVGVSTRTYWEHMQLDAHFHEAWEEVIDICESSLVGAMYANGLKPGGYMDRITWLRSKRPERWHPEFKINISRDSAPAKGLSDAVKGAVDAEIVGELKGIEGNAPAIVPQVDETH